MTSDPKHVVLFASLSDGSYLVRDDDRHYRVVQRHGGWYTYENSDGGWHPTPLPSRDPTSQAAVGAVLRHRGETEATDAR